ncbi:MAG TPA: DUF2339 domain-containing protein, partial [Opitutus sp.]|nr:DUF2339 domain-containing protein [Opitutus sp.]
MGAKLFAWFGGLAALLGVAFFVKYSFEHDLIPPEVRVALGFLFALSLVIGGLKIDRTRYGITAQTLCATGVVSLYAVTFACNAVYHFAPFNPVVTFLVMVLITATAFLLAVRMNAQVVALLGLLGGFLTPILVSTGKDNPFGLFGYIALLDVGLAAVALNRRWHYLVALAAAGTVFMELAWTGKFFSAPRAPLAMAIALAFSALFGAIAELGRRWQRPSHHATWSAFALPLVALGFAFYFLSFETIATRAGLFLGFVFAADIFLLLLAWRDDAARRVHLVAGAVVFTLLSLWTAGRLTTELLPWALGAALGFAALHTAFPLLLERARPTARPGVLSQIFPPLTLVLLLIPLFKLDEISLLFWPAVLLLDALAVALALLSGSLIALALVLVLTLATAGVAILRTPIDGDISLSLLFIIAVFAVFFFAAGLFLARKLGPRLLADAGERGVSDRLFGDARAQVPAFGALLPFVLLVIMSQRLAFADPSPLFGLALLLCLLVFGLTRLFVIEWLPACALAGVAALEYVWHTRSFSSAQPVTPLLWYLGFHALFAAFPFVFRKHFAALTGPWAIAALSGAVQFPLVYNVVLQAWPNNIMGLLPAGFALPPLLSLVII